MTKRIFLSESNQGNNMHRIVFLLLCSIIVISSCTTKPTTKTKEEQIEHFTKTITESNEYEYSKKPVVDSLVALLSDSALYEMCAHHESPIMRVALFPEFAKRDIHKGVEFALDNAFDTAKVEVLGGDYGNSSNVSCERLRLLRNLGSKYGVSEKEAEKIDSMILFGLGERIDLWTIHDMCKTLSPKPMYYDRLKELSEKNVGGRHEIWMVLARYKKAQDKEYFLQRYNPNKDSWTRRAMYQVICEWPAPEFRFILENSFKGKKCYDIDVAIAALMAYNDQAAYDLLKKWQNKWKDWIRVDILNAYEEHPRPLFKPIYQPIKEQCDKESAETERQFEEWKKKNKKE